MLVNLVNSFVRKKVYLLTLPLPLYNHVVTKNLRKGLFEINGVAYDLPKMCKRLYWCIT